MPLHTHQDPVTRQIESNPCSQGFGEIQSLDSGQGDLHGAAVWKNWSFLSVKHTITTGQQFHS
jgi:hypothetical protein